MVAPGVAPTGEKRARCWACDVPLMLGSTEEHHVVPQSVGGDETVDLCTPCHNWLDRLDPADREPFLRVAVDFPIPGENLRAFRMTPREVRLFFLLMVKLLAFHTLPDVRRRVPRSEPVQKGAR